MMMVVAGQAASLASGIYTPDSRNYFILMSIVQNLIGFCGTALITAIFLSTRPMTMLGLNRMGHISSILGILLTLAVGLPFLNQTVWWNAQMHFPSVLSPLEQTLRVWEETALDTTSVLLDTNSTGGLIVNILVIGIFTGFSEELCFRGAIQRIIGSAGMNTHLAVWITAIIFSLLHFQFFGFIPRVLLGAFFGYLFAWTGSIYTCAAAHALNNSIVVITHWLTANGYASLDFDSIGVTEHGFPALACISLALVLCVLIGMRRYMFPTTKL